MRKDSKGSWCNRFLSGLGGRWIWDKPYFLRDPKSYGDHSIWDDRHAKTLGELLQIGAPWLVEQWYNVVLYSTYEVRRIESEIAALAQKKESVAKKVGELEAELANQPRINYSPDNDTPALDLPESPKIEEPKIGDWEKVLTIGLSLMLFLGLVEILGLDLDNLVFPADLPKLTVAVAGAICMNVAEYQGIYRIVSTARRFEPRYAYRQDDRYPSPIPFWHRFRSGDPAVWISLTFILMETLFAFIGLINLFMPSQQEQLIFQVATFAAAGLAATINLTMAWGDALTRVQWQRTVEEQEQAYRQVVEERKQAHRQQVEARIQDEEYLKRREQYWFKEEELDRERQVTAKQLGEAREELTETAQQLEKLENKLPNLEARALLEHERWELAVRKWIRNNATQLENFKQLYPQWHQEIDSITGNGHRPSRRQSILPTNDAFKLD